MRKFAHLNSPMQQHLADRAPGPGQAATSAGSEARQFASVRKIAVFHSNGAVVHSSPSRSLLIHSSNDESARIASASELSFSSHASAAALIG